MTSTDDIPAERGGLRRDLGFLEPVGTALSVMSPTFGMAFAVPLVAAAAGRAVAFAFVVAGGGALVIAAAFVAFGRRIANAGSVSAFVASVFGRRAGLLTAWLLLLTYGFAGALSLVVFGAFGMTILAHVVAPPPEARSLLGVAGLAFVYWLCARRIEVTGRILLAIELLGLACLAGLAWRTLAQVPPTVAPLLPDPARGWGDTARGISIALMFYSGFESATTLGEETCRPHRTIPVVMVAAILIVAATFVLSSWTQLLGFGVDRVSVFATQTAPLDGLARRYVSGSFALLLDAIVCVSGIACAAGATLAGARLLYAMRRDGLFGTGMAHGPAPLARAVRAIIVVDLALLGITAVVGADAFVAVVVLCNAFGVILVYAAVCTAFAVETRARRAHAAAAATALLLLAGLLVGNMVPWPAWSGTLSLLIVAGWLAIGALGVVRAGSPARKGIA